MTDSTIAVYSTAPYRLAWSGKGRPKQEEYEKEEVKIWTLILKQRVSV